jgi:carboxymethylenebutenolidase
MIEEKYTSKGKTYTIAIHPGPADGKRHPMILVVHGNYGLNPPFGAQIHRFAEDLAALGYVTAVPRYYVTDPLEPIDSDALPHEATLTDAIAHVAKRKDADVNRLGLVGYSLGAATSMTYIASNPTGTVKVLIDFFGPLNAKIRAGIARFPPTFIFHNDDDKIVDVENSRELDRLLGTTTPPRLMEHKESNPRYRNHPFVKDGKADKESREKATAEILKHLPPGGK